MLLFLALKTNDLALPLLAAWTEVPAAVTLMVPEIAIFPPLKFLVPTNIPGTNPRK